MVASLGDVSDESTRALMSRFYENLWQKRQPPAKALREAQLYMLREGRPRGSRLVKPEGADTSKSDRLPPFYWAAFVLSTDRP